MCKYKQPSKQKLIPVVSEVYVLYEPTGEWVGQVVITSNGMISILSEYGNFVAFFQELIIDFKKHLLLVSLSDFASELYKGTYYNKYLKSNSEKCDKAAAKILPLLRKQLTKKIKL